jgi:integrase
VSSRAKGQVLHRRAKGGWRWAIRFNAYGRRRYLTLGRDADGWTRRRAEEELANVLADVRRDLWVEPGRGGRRRKRRKADPLFGPFATGLLEERRGELSEGSLRYLAWGFSHLSTYFSDWRLREIDAEAVDGYRSEKSREAEARRRAIAQGRPGHHPDGRVRRPLSATSINKSIDVLQWFLATAEDYGLIDSNPARGKRRRVPVERRAPVYLDTAGQIEALLDAASQLDRQAQSRIRDRLPIVGTLVFAGLRSGELGTLRWRDVDLEADLLQVRHSKTPAGLREVPVLPILKPLLLRKEEASPGRRQSDLVFATRTGRARSKDDIRARILMPATERADQMLELGGRPPLPPGLSPHSLRHTFASILIADGQDPVSVMHQLGHTTPEFTLRTYAHMMRRDAGERERLRTLVRHEWARF